MKQKKGFTLIELLAVVVIVAIIGSIGIYSITKIINTAREKALTNTAIMIRKAVRVHLNNSEGLVWGGDNTLSLNLTPGNDKDPEDPDNIPRGDVASLMELTKDPWGGDYRSIIAVVERIGDKKEITLYIRTSKGVLYELTNDGESVSPVLYELNALSLTDPLKTGQVGTISFVLNKAFGTPTVQTKLYDTSDNEIETGYTVGALSGSNGEYTITPVTINVPGAYYFEITATSLGQSTSIRTNNFTVTNSTAVTMGSSYTAYLDIAKNYTFTLASNLTITNVTAFGANQTIQPSGNYTINKTYTSTGTKNETVSVTDSGGNTITHNFTVNVTAMPYYVPSTVYFLATNVTVNSLTAKSLSSASPTGMTLMSDSSVDINKYASGLRLFIKVSKRNAAGAETVISDYRQAQVTVMPWVGSGVHTANYNFPGWTGGATTDSLIVEVGTSNASSGNPIKSQKFTTEQVGSVNVGAQTWTVSYYAVNAGNCGNYECYTSEGIWYYDYTSSKITTVNQ